MADMDGVILVARGDLTQLHADAIAYSTDLWGHPGQMYAAFRENFPEFEGRSQAALKQVLGRRRELSLGDTAWLDLQGDHPPYGIVLVAATDNRPLLETWGTSGIPVAAAVERAVTELRRRGRRDRLLIALPAFRRGERGDRAFQVDSATVQIQAAQEVLSRHPQVDLAFIAYRPDIYQIYLEARRKVPGARPSAPSGMPPPDLVSAIRGRESVLFVGAGLSEAAGLPGWKALTDEMAARLGEAPVRDDPEAFLDLAQRFRDQDPEALYELLHQHFGAGADAVRPTLAHYLLLALPFDYVITTNYDLLLERALRALCAYPIRVVRQPEVAGTGHRHGVHVIKLHGDIECRDEEVVVSRKDYASFFQRRPAMAALIQGLLLNQVFFFAGYSLRDPDFRQIYDYIARILQGAQRTAYAATFAPDRRSPKEPGPLIRLPVPGRNREIQRLNWLRFLDQLSEAVAEQPALFLAWDADGSNPETSQTLDRLRCTLRHVGTLVEMAAAAPLKPEQVPTLARLLEVLTEHGWHPTSGAALWEIWEQLARQASRPADRRQLLIRALAYTESYDDARHLFRCLDEESAAPTANGRFLREAS